MASAATPTASPHLLHPSSPAYRKAEKHYYKTTKNRHPNTSQEWTPFRAAEKRYKSRFPSPDLSNVLDLAQLDPTRTDELTRGVWAGTSDPSRFVELSQKASDSSPRKAYTIPSVPGLVILPSFVSPDKQRSLIRWALCSQACFPNETNLDTHYLLPREGIWNSYLNSRSGNSEDRLVLPKASELDVIPSTPSGPRQLVNNLPASPDTYDTISSTPKLSQAPSPNVQPTLCSKLLYKLRWANIGWYYHWGTKQYDFSRGKERVDTELRELCRSAVDAVDWHQVFGGTDEEWGEAGPDWMDWNETYEPDAGIVNFYQPKDTLMAHVDRSEVCATSPLVSISLGNAAIFLIGSNTRDKEPECILLRSGDVVIMSGPGCRRAYHGVPRILEGSLPFHLQKESLDDCERDEWEPYDDYIKSTRINVNVRQWEKTNKQQLYMIIDSLHIKMENDQGVLVDLYVPRKCAATNRLITSKDHASVQISIVDVDANGRALNTSTTFALCGQVRSQGEGDDSINRLATKAGLLRNVWSYQK